MDFYVKTIWLTDKKYCGLYFFLRREKDESLNFFIALGITSVWGLVKCKKTQENKIKNKKKITKLLLKELTHVLTGLNTMLYLWRFWKYSLYNL